MQDHFSKSTTFFQELLCPYFQHLTSQVVETLVLLCVRHLFGLDNPKIKIMHPFSSNSPLYSKNKANNYLKAIDNTFTIN